MQSKMSFADGTDIMTALEVFGFELDPILGHRLKEGQDFIGEKDFVSLEDQLKEIRLSKKKVILSIGDSSTSGWDFNVHIQNLNRLKKGLDIKPLFFKYPTYTDMLRSQVGHSYIVINAGMPGYSSMQGAKRLKMLLKIFEQNKIKVSYVTSYFGNNDSFWWSKGEDKDWVDVIKPNHQVKPKPSNDQVTTRVAPEDFKTNLKSILTQCNEHGIVPILIEPVTAIYWKPGAFDINEWVPLSPNVAPKIKELLDEALYLWAVAMKDKQYSEMKQLLLEEAREKDYLTTRIKKNHLKVLRETAAISETAFVAITLDRTIDDGRFFLDFCHPINQANKLLADGIKKVISDLEQGKGLNLTRLPMVSKSLNNPISKSKASDDLIPRSQYPLY